MVKPRVASRFEAVKTIGPGNAGSHFGGVEETVPAANGLEVADARNEARTTQFPAVAMGAREERSLISRATPRPIETRSAAGVGEREVESAEPREALVPRRMRRTNSRATSQARDVEAAPVAEEKAGVTGSRSRKTEGRDVEHRDAADAVARTRESGGATLADLDAIAQRLFARNMTQEPRGEKLVAKPQRGEPGLAEKPREATLTPILSNFAPSISREVDPPRFERAAPKQDIHIVIERLTVLGASTPAQPYAAMPTIARPTPKLTLDQYLQQRRSGE